MDLSEILATAAFPITEEGLAGTAAWLEEQVEKTGQDPGANTAKS